MTFLTTSASASERTTKRTPLQTELGGVRNPSCVQLPYLRIWNVADFFRSRGKFGMEGESFRKTLVASAYESHGKPRGRVPSPVCERGAGVTHVP